MQLVDVYRTVPIYNWYICILQSQDTTGRFVTYSTRVQLVDLYPTAPNATGRCVSYSPKIQLVDLYSTVPRDIERELERER